MTTAQHNATCSKTLVCSSMSHPMMLARSIGSIGAQVNFRANVVGDRRRSANSGPNRRLEAKAVALLLFCGTFVRKLVESWDPGRDITRVIPPGRTRRDAD